MTTRSLDEMTDAELEQYMAERKAKKVLTNPDNSASLHNENKGEGENNGENSGQRSQDIGGQGRGLSEGQPTERIQGNDQEGSRRVLPAEGGGGEVGSGSSDVNRDIGTRSVESGNQIGDTREQQRLEPKDIVLNNNSERKPASIVRDNRAQNKITITHNDPHTKTWEKHPGSMDVLGVDTPPNITKATRLPGQRARISQRGARISGRMPRISNRMGKLR